MKRARLILFTCALGIGCFARSSPAAAQAAEAACVPACRAGYACVGGQCVSACNPPCPAGQECTAQAECVPAQPVTPTPATPPSTAPASAAPASATPPSPAPPPASTAPATTAIAAGAPAAPAPSDRSWQLGAKLGVVLPGGVYVDPPGEEFDTTAGPLLQAYLDGFVMPKFSVGLIVQNAFSGVTMGGEDFDATVTTLGGTLKAHFGGASVKIRPALVLAYQLISADDAFDEATKGLDVGAQLEFAFPLSPSVSGVGEVGFISQPAGGNEDADVTFAPTFYLAGGVEFGG